MTLPVPVTAPERVSICRTAPESADACPFVAFCHESRQRLMHYEGLRGSACWYFQSITERQQAYVREHASQDSCTCGHALPLDLDRWRCPWCGTRWQVEREPIEGELKDRLTWTRV